MHVAFPISNGMIEIVQKENPVLRKRAEEIPVSEITSPKIKKVIKIYI